MTTPIIIDCDPGHDDAIALMLAVASPGLDLRAVTTVAGNTTIDKTTANAIRILDLLGQDTPVAAGAARPLVRELVVAEYVHGPSGLDGPTLYAPSREPRAGHAIHLIAEVLEHSESPVTLVPVGPLTNIALFLAVYPELVDRIDRLVVMGGAMVQGNVTASAEFNIYTDPEAAARVFSSGLDVTMIGLDVTHQALLRKSDAQRLASGGKVSHFVAELFGFFSRSEPDSRRLGGAPIHDAAAVAHLIWPDLVVTEHRSVEVDLGTTSRGRTVVDRRPGAPINPNLQVAVDIDGDRFTRLLVEAIESLDS
ncbi:MAG TPA: nucleoside hydrolase [Acidimicrobiia bacterium]|nr:nucleoside hydrolase [Acidimicrobiia bacterium]